MAVRNKQAKAIIISPLAKADIIEILNYLSQTWGEKVADEFLEKLNTFYFLVSINPRLFGFYNKQKNIRKYLQNIIYYGNKIKEIQIITVFDTRQNPAN
jgi:plasmid stabilization system protein ParE